MMKNKKIGFTLAEVLITLTIIGVVAGMTIPSLIVDYERQRAYTALMKAYSVGNQALMRVALKNGDISSIRSYFSTTSSQHAFAADFAAQFNVVKNCGTSVGAGCFQDFNKNIDGTGAVVADDTNYYKFISADGMAYSIINLQDNCTNRGISDDPMVKACGAIRLDINGAQGPNYRGKDIFLFWITSNKGPLIYPQCGFYDNRTYTGNATDGGDYYWNYGGANKCSTSSPDGGCCAARIFEKGMIDYY